MGFLSKLFNRGNGNEPFLGEWISDLSHQKTLSELGDVKLTFRDDKTLKYEIRDAAKSQIINMVYSVKDNTIITDQPSYPKKEKTEFYFEREDILVLKFNGEESRFKKITP